MVPASLDQAGKRATGIEPATSSLEGSRATSYTTPAAGTDYRSGGRVDPASALSLRGSQDSNLESPVLETGAFVQFGHCPWQWIVAARFRPQSMRFRPTLVGTYVREPSPLAGKVPRSQGTPRSRSQRPRDLKAHGDSSRDVEEMAGEQRAAT